MQSRILFKYVYKTYFELLHDREFLLLLSRYGWVKPAVIPRAYYLFENFLIRKYLTIGEVPLIKDLEFQRILCRAGFYGPACTTTTTSTTSSTTTTTTTAAPIIIDVQNNTASGVQITNVTVAGVTLTGAIFPVVSGNDTAGTTTASSPATMAVSITGTFGSVTVSNAFGLNACLNSTGPGTYSFPGTVISGPGTPIVSVSDSAC